jgi:two-component system CheB/CheR fusion protein
MFIGELVCRQFNDGRLQGVVRDITERKQIEAALRDEAKRKDEFLALLGHELRNPLAAISTAIEVLSDGVNAGRRAEIEGMMSRQVNLMRRLLDDLLDLGRITHGHIELKKESIDLAEFIQKAAASLQSVIVSRRQELVLRLPSESVVFMADRMRLEQIASNLLSNASKYSGPGCRIEFSGAREGSAVVLHCKDNGQGVLPEYRDKIFEPFTRGRNIHDSHGEASLGIGLALAKQLTELHEGTISVDSAGADMGSDFIVRLPLVPPQFAAGSVEAKPEVRPHSGGSIVIVEDNPDIAELMQITLKQAGYQVNTFADGVSALAAVPDLKPDAVLLDIGLPGMDGYELAAEMKKRSQIGNALFIGLSGFKRREGELTSGGDFDHYFTKPVDVRALIALLDARSRLHSQESSRIRVLLVEDHPDLAAATESMLRSEGLEVQTALTGRHALEIAQNFRPQLILCDMNLPDMDGLEVIRRLKSDASLHRGKAVILTAMSELEIQAYNSKAGKLGVDAFIGKPIKTDVLRNLAAKLKAE